MAQEGQSPTPYEPKYTQIVEGTNVEHVRQSPEGLVGNDGTDDRVLIGFHKDGFGNDHFGIKVSQAGSNVAEADDGDLIMSSAFNMFKIVQTGTASITATLPGVDGSSFSTSVPHNLGFTPVAFAFIFNELTPTLHFPLPYDSKTYSATVSNLVSSQFIDFNLDDTDIFFEWRFGYAGIPYISHDIDIKYYLMLETAA